MPVIPLIRPGALPNAAPAVLDRNQRPTQDTRAVQAGVERLGRSTRKPELPAQLAAPAAALGAIGDAIARTGNIFGAVEQKRHEAEVYNQRNEAEQLRELRRLEFNEGLEKERPERYKELWAKHSEKVAREIAALPLNPEARERVRIETDFWTKAGAAQIGALANKVTFGRARQGNEIKIENKIQARDHDGMVSEFNFGVAQGWRENYELPHYEKRFKETVERQTKEAEAVVVEVGKNHAITVARTEGAEAANKAIETLFGELDEQSRAQLRSIARHAANEATFTDVQDVVTRIYAKDGMTDAQIEAVPSKHLTGEDRVKLKKLRADYDSFKAAEWRDETDANGVRNSAKAFIELSERVKAFDPDSKNAKLDYMNLIAENRRKVGSADAGYLDWLLNIKSHGMDGVGKVPADSIVTKFVDDTLDVVFDAKGPNGWKIPSLAPGKSERDPETPSKWDWRDDPKKHEDAIQAKAQILQDLRTWMEMNPQDARDLEQGTEQSA